jgi:hypothetical protein
LGAAFAIFLFVILFAGGTLLILYADFSGNRYIGILVIAISCASGFCADFLFRAEWQITKLEKSRLEKDQIEFFTLQKYFRVTLATMLSLTLAIPALIAWIFIYYAQV